MGLFEDRAADASLERTKQNAKAFNRFLDILIEKGSAIPERAGSCQRAGLMSGFDYAKERHEARSVLEVRRFGARGWKFMRSNGGWDAFVSIDQSEIGHAWAESIAHQEREELAAMTEHATSDRPARAARL